ncbi:MAG: hypothetical protein O7B99_08835 [Planctomycetota bacterium]|nr:hypothetical protein [Planctomycetota bacterium]
MSSSPKKPVTGKSVPGQGTAHIKTRTPRPDELTRETFEFITAIDEYKRKHMRSFLDDVQVLAVAHELGWRPPGGSKKPKPTKKGVGAFATARDAYRVENGRLFPSWSEVFELLMKLGYERETEDNDAA